MRAHDRRAGHTSPRFSSTTWALIAFYIAMAFVVFAVVMITLNPGGHYG